MNKLTDTDVNQIKTPAKKRLNYTNQDSVKSVRIKKDLNSQKNKVYLQSKSR